MTKSEFFRQSLSGPISSVSTTFDRDGAIDEGALRAGVEFAVTEAKSGTILLTYGDSLLSVLTDREVAEVTRIVVEQTAGRKMVVAAGCWWTGEAVRFAEYCRTLGADLFMPLPPNWAGSCTEQTLVDHFERISRVMPVMLVTAIGPGVSVPLGAVRTLLQRDTGIVAIMRAAMPDGMVCSPQATSPIPPPRSSAPTIAESRHSRRVGQMKSPRARARLRSPRRAH